MPHIPGHTPQAPETPEQRNRRLQRQFEQNRRTPAVPSLATPSRPSNIGGPQAPPTIPVSPVVPLTAGQTAYGQRYQGQATLSQAAANAFASGVPGFTPGAAIVQATAGGIAPPNLAPGARTQAPPSTEAGTIQGLIGDAARWTAQAIAAGQFPNLLSPQVASAMGVTEQQRIAMGYNPQWPYNQLVPASGLGVGGGTGGGRRRAGGGAGGSRGFGGGVDLINWRIG